MVTKRTDDDENAHEDYLRTRRMWKSGKRKNWFYPATDGPHVQLFWDKAGKACLEYSDGGSNTSSMVRAGHKLEHYAYGMEQLEEKLGEDFHAKVVHEMVMAMRNWSRVTREKWI